MRRSCVPDGRTPLRSRAVTYGDVDKGFQQSDIVKEFTYYFGGARPIPFQPVTCIAMWEGDKLTFYGTAQGIYPQREALAKGLGIPEEKVHYINKWNGGTFGPATHSARYFLFVAQIAKETKRPVKLMLPKDHELAQMSVKAENITKFKVGATKDGKIIACQREFFIAAGRAGGGGAATVNGQGEQAEVRAVPARCSELERIRIHLLHEFHGDRSLLEATPSRNTSGRGKT